MYYVFQEEGSTSSVVFVESCETEEELKEIINTAPYPIRFIYNSETKAITKMDGYYTLDQIWQLIRTRISN